MKTCPICRVMTTDDAVYCMRGHKQEIIIPEMPDFINDLFRGFDKDKKDDNAK